MPPDNFDPTDAAFIADPYPTLAGLRESGPVIWSERFSMWLVTRHADVLAVQRDRRLGRVRAGHARPEDLRPIRTMPDIAGWATYYDVERYSLLMLEPPEHTRIRSLVSRAFTPRRVRDLRPAITTIADELVAGLDRSGFDLLEDYARPFSIRVIATLLGAPIEDADRLLFWSHAIVRMYELAPTRQEAEAAIQACREFAAWTTELVEHRRRQPTGDLISDLAAAETEEGRLSIAEIVSTVILLLNAGHEATVNTMGNGVTALLRHHVWDAVGATGPATVVEEMLRWDSPLQLFERWVLEDGYELAGVPLPVGGKVAMLFGSANRDPRAFAQPDRFDIRRGDASHITFGGGTHFCLGAPLARLELEIALAALTRELPCLELRADPVRIPAFVIRGYQAVPVGC